MPEALHQIQSFLSPFFKKEFCLVRMYLCYPQIQCVSDQPDLQWDF